MSIYHLTWVWENGPAAPSERLMLLALADHANDSGTCYPGVTRLAKKCAVTVRTAQKTLRKLEADGWIETTIGGGRRQNTYLIMTGHPRHPRHLTPVTSDTPAPSPTTGESSVEPSIDPPVENHHALPANVTVFPDEGYGVVIMCNACNWFIESCKCGVARSEPAYVGGIDHDVRGN